MAKKPVQKKPATPPIIPIAGAIAESAVGKAKKIAESAVGKASFANRKDFENTNRQAPGYGKKTAAPASSPKAKPAAPKKVVLGPPAPKAKPAAKKGKR